MSPLPNAEWDALRRLMGGVTLRFPDGLTLPDLSQAWHDAGCPSDIYLPRKDWLRLWERLEPSARYGVSDGTQISLTFWGANVWWFDE